MIVSWLSVIRRVCSAHDLLNILLAAPHNFPVQRRTTMAARRDVVSITARLLVFGGLAIMGGMLALAQVSAPATRDRNAANANAQAQAQNRANTALQPDQAA